MNRNTTRDYPLVHTGNRDIVIRTGSGTPKATVTLVAWSVTPGRRFDWGIDAEGNAFEVGRNGWRPAITRFAQREWYSWKNHLGKLEMYFIVDRTDKTVVVREAMTGKVYRRHIDVYRGVEQFLPEGRWRGCPIIGADDHVETPVAIGGAA
ncbi:MAG: hypothetical protein VXW73_01955 [Actinomycetota bacterium]|nr:hypothetical protein [Actinomycetota bacterium]MEC7457960.1 hypothetical protein [Actinomycetota bacterium]MED5346188.1 hypothetical protein [Actinomycetota bacterium]MEE3040103.1 hypothetical protein [Candidatus Latescibacterota bacterium]